MVDHWPLQSNCTYNLPRSNEPKIKTYRPSSLTVDHAPGKCCHYILCNQLGALRVHCYFEDIFHQCNCTPLKKHVFLWLQLHNPTLCMQRLSIRKNETVVLYLRRKRQSCKFHVRYTNSNCNNGFVVWMWYMMMQCNPKSAFIQKKNQA